MNRSQYFCFVGVVDAKKISTHAQTIFFLKYYNFLILIVTYICKNLSLQRNFIIVIISDLIKMNIIIKNNNNAREQSF
jgi:hypothetical protein